MSQRDILIIFGPTASGKTDLAKFIFDNFQTELISVDSAQIYTEMDIGTAKPAKNILKKYPHHLINIKTPMEQYSVAEFIKDVDLITKNTPSELKFSLFVGGTMMYFKSLIEGISPLPEADADIRMDIESEANENGWPAMHKLLATFDEKAALRIHENDPQRISRAIEVFRKTGKTLSQLTEIKGDKLSGPVLQFAITPKERSDLHARIALRFEQMISQGFQQEVESLQARNDLHHDLPAIRCVGYRQMWQYLNNECNHDEMVFKGICATRQLVKRQLTWLRSWQDLHWLNMEDENNLQVILSAVSKV